MHDRGFLLKKIGTQRLDGNSPEKNINVKKFIRLELPGVSSGKE
jgi:hypothetical protein